MSKSYLTHDLSKATVCVGLMVHVVRLCHASVSRIEPKPNTDFSLECMEVLHSNTSLANCYIPTRLTPVGLL